MIDQNYLIYIVIVMLEKNLDARALGARDAGAGAQYYTSKVQVWCLSSYRKIIWTPKLTPVRTLFVPTSGHNERLQTGTVSS